MENRRKISIMNLMILIMLVACLLMGIILIILSKSKLQVDLFGKSGKEIKNSYTTTEENTTTNTWDISINGDGTVMATLKDDGTLTISGTGDMKYWGGRYHNRLAWDDK